MQIKTEPRILRFLIYSFMILPLIPLHSDLLHPASYQKVAGDSSVKHFALDGDSSYFNPKFSFQNAMPIFSNTIIPYMILRIIFPTLSDNWRAFGGYLSLFVIQSRYLASGNFVWLISSSMFCNTSWIYSILDSCSVLQFLFFSNGVLELV